MRRGFRRIWVVTGLALLGAMIAGAREARANLTGITIGGGIKPGNGDPAYNYIFDVYLTSGSISPDYGSQTTTFTISGLVGVSGWGFDPSQILAPSSPSGPPTTASPGSTQAGEYWTTPSGGIVTTPSSLPVGYQANGYNYQSSVEWEYLLGPTINYTNPGPNGVFLGEFMVNTSWSYGSTQPAPLGAGTVIDYQYTSGGTTLDGSFVLQNLAAPEPSSAMIVLLTGGIGAIYGLVVRARRRRLARAAC